MREDNNLYAADIAATQDYILEQVVLGMSRHFGFTSIDSVKTQIDVFSNHFVAQVKASVFGNAETVSDSLDIQVPASWFQQLKQDCFPKWLLHIFPVRHKTISVPVKIDLQRYYPKLNIAVFGEQPQIKLKRTTTNY